jgi:hypothetical protein
VAALGGLVQTDLGRDPLAAAVLEHGRVDGDLDGVEDDLAGRGGDRDGDALDAREGRGVEVGLQAELVAGGDHVSGQTVGAHGSVLYRTAAPVAT